MMTLRHGMTTTPIFLALVLAAGHPAGADEPLLTFKVDVNLDGKPLPLGRVIFYLDDDQFTGAKIKDGTCRVSRVPEGDWRVEIEGEGVPAKFPSKPLFTVRIRKSKAPIVYQFDLKSDKKTGGRPAKADSATSRLYSHFTEPSAMGRTVLSANRPIA
jgi:hypothetical protein